MKSMVRTFVAVEIDEPTRRAAADWMERLRAVSPDVGWVAPHNMHLTVKFLGDVRAERIPQVCQAVAQAVADVDAFDLEIRGAGAFPNIGRPRTIWLGAGEGEASLAELAQRVEKALANFGFPREDRPFRAHLTLGRVRRPGSGLAALAPLLQDRDDFAFGRSRIGEVVVFSSQLQRGGPIYEALSRAPLAGLR